MNIFHTVIQVFRIVVQVLRCRGRSTDELVGSLDAPTTVRPQPRREAPITTVRVVQRLLCGLQNPLRETAVTARVLRALGYPTHLVIGYEPVPMTGDRRLFSWLEIAGRVRGTGMPAQTFYPQLWRFPA